MLKNMANVWIPQRNGKNVWTLDRNSLPNNIHSVVPHKLVRNTAATDVTYELTLLKNLLVGSCNCVDYRPANVIRR